jgi:stage IV sporulation protein FB
MPNTTYTLGRIFNLPVRLYPSMKWSLGLLSFMALLVGYSIMGTLFIATGALGSIFLHELGHVWAAREKGYTLKEVRLSILGTPSTLTPPSSADLHDKMLVIMAGPAVSLILCLFCASISPLFPLALINAGLLLLNLLPLLPLDGGRALSIWLAQTRGEAEASRFVMEITTFTCVILGMIGLATPILIPLIPLSIFIYQRGKEELTLLELKIQTSKKGRYAPPLDVEVSPPPYAEKETRFKSLIRRILCRKQ